MDYKENELFDKLDRDKLPSHIAIIMDGNGRWAQKRGLPRPEGHRQGVEAVREIVTCSHELGISALTLFAFSTENWKRPPWEVNFLMSLPEQYLKSELPRLVEKNVQIKLIGDPRGLPSQVRKAINKGLRESEHNSGMKLNFALNYGARDEIVKAVAALVEEDRAGKLKGVISEEKISSYLYTGKLQLPDPDLLIRTGGEYRVSNFLLWQLAYSELYFSTVYWPDFNRSFFYEAILEYQNRERRFGAV